MRKLVFLSVLLVVLSALMFSVGLTIPAFIFSGICLCVLIAYGGFIPAAISTVLALLICSHSCEGAVEFLLGGIVPGICIGLGYIRRLRLPQAMIAPSLSFCGMWVYIFAVYKKSTGHNMFEDVAAMVTETAKQSWNSLVAESSLSESLAAELNSVLEASMNVTKLVVPSFIMLFSCFLSFVIIMLSKKLVFKYGGPIVSFSKIHVPPSATIVTIVCAALFFVIKTSLRIFLGNILIVMFFFYFLCGLSMIDFFLRRKIARTYLRILVYILALMFLGLIIPQFVFTFIFLSGVLDSLFDFRKLRPRKNDTV